MAHGQSTNPRSYASRYAPGTQFTNIPRYTFNKYYYHNPAVSPYSNLMRRSGSYVNNYFQYVRPEQERRQRQSMRMNEPLRTGGRSLGTGTSTMGRGSVPSQYHNHWYGGRQALGLR